MNRACQPSAATALRFGQPVPSQCCGAQPTCDRFCPRNQLVQPRPASIGDRLDELMRRCREDGHRPTYQDLLDLKGRS